MAILLPLDVQYFNGDDTVAAGKQMFTYIAGSSTKTTTWTDSTGGTARTNPIVLDGEGRPPNGLIWGIAGVTYDLHLASPTDTDPPTGATIPYDGIIGVESPTSTQSEWVASGQDGTYISATSFSVVGDQTATYEVGRRLKLIDSGGTKYVTIDTATFGAVTTIVVRGDALAVSITDVSYALLSATNDSLPRIHQLDYTWSVKTAAYTAISGDGIFGDTSTTAAFTVTLPATPALGDKVAFCDYDGNWAVANLTVARNGETIMGLAEDMIASTNEASFELIYNGTDWRLF